MSPVALNGVDKQGVYVNGVQVKQALNAANETVNKGVYDPTTLSAVDADLQAGNIKLAENIFGFVGTVAGGGVETYELFATANIAHNATYTPNVSGIFFNGVGAVDWGVQYQSSEPVWRAVGVNTTYWGATAIGDGTNFRVKNSSGGNAVYCLMRHYIDTGTYERYSSAQLAAGTSYTPSDEGFFGDGVENADLRIQLNRSDGWQAAYEVKHASDDAPITLAIGDGTNLRLYNEPGTAWWYALMRAVMT